MARVDCFRGLRRLLSGGMCLAAWLLSSAALQAVELDVPTHREIEPIRIELGPAGKIETMAMDSRGNLLVGVSWASDRPGAAPPAPLPAPYDRRMRQSGFGPAAGPRDYAVRVVSPQGRVVATWQLEDIEPKMLHGCPNGDVYVCGEGRVALFNSRGVEQRRVSFADLLGGQYAQAHSSGVTACDDYVFLALGEGFSLRATEDIVRLDRDLANPKLVVQQQFGCCSHIDLDVRDDRLLIAENSRHRVRMFSFDGEDLGTWGSRDRVDLAGFAACCNPVNFDFGPDDVLYTAESGVGRVKRYTASGEFLGLVGYVDTTKFDNGSALAAASCYIPVEVAADGSRIYVMDVRANFIRVLQRN